jgi:peptidoglycan hydrolase CwlO-like protein
MTTNLPNRIDRLEALAETTLLAIQQQQTQITDLRASVTDLRASVADVVGMVGTLAEQQNDMQQEITGLRLESRRILDYLLNQRGEGGNNS